MNRRRGIAVLLTAVVAIGLVSTTLGRAIYAGQTPGLASFAAIHFAGYLFFLLMPVEALIPIYQAEGHRGSTLIVLAVGTAVAAQIIDYCIGRAVSDRAIGDLIGEDRYRRFQGKIERWGGWAILLFNLFPLSSPNMLLVAGLVRYNVWKTFAFSTLGLVGKYTAIVYIFDAASWWLSRTP